jgi:hypothetical protein
MSVFQCDRCYYEEGTHPFSNTFNESIGQTIVEAVKGVEKEISRSEAV